MLNVFEELAETSRRQILAELRSGPKSVGDIVCATGLKQPNVSNHLARMKAREIVRCERCGRQMYYALANPEVEAVVQAAFMPSGACARCDFSELIERYATAAVAGDEAACGAVLEIAFRERMPMLDIYQEILAPAMRKIGTWYKEGTIHVAQEHLASYLTEQMMARTAQITGPLRRHSRTVMLGCAPNCWHVIGLRMISDYLRYCGWRTFYLGANVPKVSFLSAIKQQQPHLVLLSCACDEGTPETLDLITALCKLRSEGLKFQIGIGGRQVEAGPQPFLTAGADFAATDLRQFATNYLPGIEGSTRC